MLDIIYVAFLPQQSGMQNSLPDAVVVMFDDLKSLKTGYVLIKYG
jgi:hypothetical protein